jgi:hypothetical protein
VLASNELEAKMVQSDENIAYRFGGFDFGFTPDGSLILTILYIDSKAEPRSQSELYASVRKIHFRMPDGAARDLGEAAARAAEIAPPIKQ